MVYVAIYAGSAARGCQRVNPLNPRHVRPGRNPSGLVVSSARLEDVVAAFALVVPAQPRTLLLMRAGSVLRLLCPDLLGVLAVVLRTDLDPTRFALLAKLVCVGSVTVEVEKRAGLFAAATPLQRRPRRME